MNLATHVACARIGNMADHAQWNARLSGLLGFESAEIIEYLFTLSNEREIIDYLDQLLGPGPEQQRFKTDFVNVCASEHLDRTACWRPACPCCHRSLVLTASRCRIALFESLNSL